MPKRKFPIGPAAMVAAAFIGPGTVTTASLAGAKHGYSLLWAVLFAILATIILQEMAARLGVVGRLGLGEAIRRKITHPIGFLLSAILVISAILIGNAAYETGNITGALMGLPALPLAMGSLTLNVWVLLMGVFAFLLLYVGAYKWIERVLVGLVGLMSVIFILTAIILQPPLGEILKGLIVPGIPEGGLLLTIGLIGTTIVPYNLFLHASSSKKRWDSPEGYVEARRDTLISVSVGGLITLAICLSSAVVFFSEGLVPDNIGQLAQQLEPLLGPASSTILGIGFFAAGLSSSLTAPLAAAYATSGLLGWPSDFKDRRFRAVWMLVLFTGLIFSLAGFKPIPVILFAQVANGLLLPVIVGFLLWVMNDAEILGNRKNKLIANILGLIILGIALILGGKSILSVLGII